MKMKKNFRLFIVLLAILLIIFMVSVTYANLPKCDDSQIILSSVTIRDYGVGFTTETDHLRFGELAAQSHVYRSVTLNSTKDYNVEVMVYGEMSRWLVPEFDEFESYSENSEFRPLNLSFGKKMIDLEMNLRETAILIVLLFLNQKNYL